VDYLIVDAQIGIAGDMALSITGKSESCETSGRARPSRINIAALNGSVFVPQRRAI
jgi:hypothetical protein